MTGLRFLVFFLVAASISTAKAQDCPALYAGGQTPVLINAKLAERTQALCFEAFSVLHSGVTRTPLYAAEHLTRESIAAARAVARDDTFHEETRLPPEARARLEDYVRSGFDRGHLAPAADMPSVNAQTESFSLANIVPQDRTMNRGIWSDIEESVRRLATRRGSLYVITGVVFAGDSLREIGAGVLVPTQLYKAIYDPTTGEAGAYLIANTAGRDWQGLSLAALRQATGVDVFPTLSPQVKATAMTLPDPQASSRGEARRQDGSPDHGWREWLLREVMRELRRTIRAFLRQIF